MTKEHNSPVTIHIYLGSGPRALKIRENLEKLVPDKRSLSQYVVELLEKSNPKIFHSTIRDEQA